MLGGKFSRPHTASENYLLGPQQLAAMQINPNDFAVLNGQTFHHGVFVYLGAALTSALGQRQRGINRVGLTISGQVNPAAKISRFNPRPLLVNKIRVDEFTVDTKGIGHSGLTLQFFKALWVQG